MTDVAVYDARKLLDRKEKEAAAARQQALQQLEGQVSEKDQCINSLTSQLDVLKTDFEFNLRLLDERDAELEKYDVEYAALRSLLQQKDESLQYLEALQMQMQSDLWETKTTAAEVETSLKARVSDLEAQLQDVKFCSQEAELQQTEYYEAQQRALQRALSEAEEEIERQRRDMAASFSVQVQQLEMQYSMQTKEAVQDAELAQQKAAALELEAREARERELQHSKAAQEAEAAAAAKEREVRALKWELDSSQKLLEARLAETTAKLQTAQQQQQLAVSSMGDQVADLEDKLAAAQRLADDVREQSTRDAHKREEQHQEDVAALQRRLEEASGRAKDLQQQVQEAHGALKLAERTHQEHLEACHRAAAADREAAEVALSDMQRQHDAQVRDVKQRVWAQEEEVRALRERSEGLRAALDQRRGDLEAYKTQLVAAGERERELQRQLVAAELKLEAQWDSQEAAASTHEDAAVRQLTAQRDTANAALQEALARCSAKDAELQVLRARMRAAAAAGPRRQAAPLPAAAPPSGPPSPRAAMALSSDALYHVIRGQRMADAAAHKADIAEAPQGNRAKPPPLSLTQSIQDLKDSLADMTSLPSPVLPDLPPTPGSTASYWLGATPATSPEPQQGPSPRSPGSPRRSSPLDRSLAAFRRSQLGATSPPGGGAVQQQAAVAALQAALEEARAQNERLQAATAMMRYEVETLQSRQQELEQQAQEAPPDAAVLRAELEASDRDLQHARDHLAVLQRQLAAVQGGADGKGHMRQQEDELGYLRVRVGELMAENRALRRHVAAAKLSELGAAVQLPEVGTSSSGKPPQASAQESSTAAAPVKGSSLPAAAAGDNDTVAQQDVAGSGSRTTKEQRVSADSDVVLEVAVGALADELQQELEAALDEVASLRIQNEQLMEMSSLLRAERDRLLLQVPHSAPVGRHHDHNPSPSSPQPYAWTQAPFLLPYFNAYRSQPSASSPPARPYTSPPTSSQALPQSPARPSTQPEPQPASARQGSVGAAIRDVLRAAAQGRHSSASLPLSAHPPTALTNVHANTVLTHSVHEASAAGEGRQELLLVDSCSRCPVPSGTHTTTTSAATPAAAAAAADGAPPRSTSSPHRRPSLPGSAQRRAISADLPSKAPATVGLTTASGPLELGTAAAPRRPSPPSRASQRETPSQRATLRALQQRRELQHKPKVRNYNVKD